MDLHETFSLPLGCSMTQLSPSRLNPAQYAGIDTPWQKKRELMLEVSETRGCHFENDPQSKLGSLRNLNLTHRQNPSHTQLKQQSRWQLLLPQFLQYCSKTATLIRSTLSSNSVISGKKREKEKKRKKEKKKKKGKKRGQIYFFGFFVKIFPFIAMLSDGILKVKQKTGRNIVQILISG